MAATPSPSLRYFAAQDSFRSTGPSWAGHDPRSALAANTNLTAGDLADIGDLLNRLDARTSWARATLARIAHEPGITAAELAANLPLSKESLKRRIRTLTEHGLTRSLHVGYELSERGHTYLASTTT